MNFDKTSKSISNQELETFKSKYRFQLPDEYEEIILESNGGYPDKSVFKGLQEIYFRPIKYGEFTIEDSISALDSVTIPASLVPFAHFDGGLLFLNGRGYPFEVYKMYEDSDLIEVASSFEAFLDGLEEEED